MLHSSLRKTLGIRFSPSRVFSRCRPWSNFHFDTHHFVQRLEREGLNRAQAEGIMAAMAEVIDESIRNMTSNMVTKAEQEKVCLFYKLQACNHLMFFSDSVSTRSKLTLHR
jgi:predicted ATP-binding protein involved in virulence